MGSQSKYDTRELAYVNITIPSADGEEGQQSVKYAFLTNIPESKASELGHVKVPVSQYSNPPLGLVLTPSFPRPKRATLREPLRCTSSFVSKDKEIAARKLGYRVARPKGRSRLIVNNPKALVQGVFVTMLGVKYGWNIPLVTSTNTGGDLSGLGINIATGADLDEVCTGANFPKPPRAAFIQGTGDIIKEISTFYDPSVSDLPKGWFVKAGGKYSII